MSHKPIRKRVKNTLIVAAIGVLVLLLRALPRFAALASARLIGRAAFFLARGERRRTLSNLELALGNELNSSDLNRTAVKVFINIAQNLADAVIIDRLLKNPGKTISVRGFETAKDALARGRGIVFLTAHTGCFELLPAWFSLKGFPVTVIGAPLFDERLGRMVSKNRRSFDVKYVERGNDLRPVLFSIRKGGCFGALCDLDTRVESRFISFFDRPAKTPEGPFRLAIRLNASLVPVFTRRAPNGMQDAVVFPVLEPGEGTIDEKITRCMENYNRLLEQFIRQDPSQWIWMHDRWKSKP